MIESRSTPIALNFSRYAALASVSLGRLFALAEGLHRADAERQEGVLHHPTHVAGENQRLGCLGSSTG
jgi:hypothetical protein